MYAYLKTRRVTCQCEFLSCEGYECMPWKQADEVPMPGLHLHPSIMLTLFALSTVKAPLRSHRH